MTNSVAELEWADCIFIIGSNTTSSHPLVAEKIFRARKRGAKLIVADPRKTQIASIADLHVRQNLGTDVALINAIMNAIISNRWHDEKFITERTEGFEALNRTLQAYTPEKTEMVTGISADKIVKIAKWYSNSKASSIVYCMGITQHVSGVDNVKSLANLAMLTGNIGRESTGVNPLRGQNNVQGACDMGGLPNVYPGYQPVNSVDVQKKFKAAWNVELSGDVGITIPEMLTGLVKGSLKALFIVGENPMVSDPDSNHVKKALRSAQFLVVQDIFMTPTAEMAHVVLPGACFAEKEGTFTNTERRVLRVRKGVDPPGEARQDWQIIQELSNRFGYPMVHHSPEEIMREIASVTPSYTGISYERLEGDGLQWPCPTIEHPGTKFLHKDRFTRGKGLFHPIEYTPPDEVTDCDYPFWLTTGRTYVHYHTGTMTRNSPSLHSEMAEGFVEINPMDGARLNLVHGQWVKVVSRRGEIQLKTSITESVGQNVVFIPFHFIESQANILTNPAFDPTAKIPEFKVCAVRIEGM